MFNRQPHRSSPNYGAVFLIGVNMTLGDMICLAILIGIGWAGLIWLLLTILEKMGML